MGFDCGTGAFALLQKLFYEGSHFFYPTDIQQE